MEAQQTRNCPQCQKEIVSLNSGKLICRSCGWTSTKSNPVVSKSTNQSQENEQQPKKLIAQVNTEETNNSELKPKNNGLYSNQSLTSAGKLFFSVGLLIMIFKLQQYSY